MAGAPADDEELRREVAEVAANLVGAYARHDAAAYFGHFAKDACFIFHSEARVLRSRAEYEEVWRRWEADDGFRVRECASANAAVRMLGRDAAVFTHDVVTTVETRRGTETLAERETIVFERNGDGWVAVHEHLSPVLVTAPAT